MKEIIGTNNRILEVDLSKKGFSIYEVTEEERRMYLGAKGLGMKLLYDRMETGCDPLGSDNMIALMPGVLMGTDAPCSARFSAVTKSPLTGIMCHASCGGPFGAALKTAGWDGVIVKGRAAGKVSIVITSEGAEFSDAGTIWGKGAFETQEALKGRGEACVIGPAGENLVRFANIVSGARFLGRGGMGAVLGSKNCKAIIAVGGDYKILPADKERFEKVKQRALKYLKANGNIKNYKLYGTNANTNPDIAAGILPVRNFTKGRSDEAYKITGEHIKEAHDTQFHTCKKCQILCGKKGDFGGRTLAVPEFETSVLLGSNLEVYDTNEIAEWNRLCGDMGMDTISTGGTLAWVMEAAEKGLVDSSLRFGSAEGVAEAIEDIALSRGFGNEMAMGSRALSEKYGGKDFAMQVKGLEMAAYDPRGCFGHGLSYAVANRGACHLSASLMVLEQFVHYLKPYSVANKPVMVKFFENMFAAINSLHTCQFTSFAYTMEPPLVKYTPVFVLRELMTVLPKVALMNLDVSVYSRLWSSITGMKLSMWAFLKAGERVHVLERYMNTREGISRKDDVLPARLLTEGRECDESGRTVPLSKMLDKYYRERGFDSNGIPTDKLLGKLGIEKRP